MDTKKLEKRFKCDVCSSAFRTKSQLKTHKSGVHSGLRPFECEHCDYSAKLKGTLQKHYVKHFPQIYKTQNCPQCPYKCSKPWLLRSHLRVHTKEKPFACNMCSYRASFYSSLARHVRTHTGEKPFKCSVCISKFSQSSNLKKHTLFVHNKNNVRLVACSFSICDRKFIDKHSVRKHLESAHVKERRFSCPHCQEMFYEKSNCISHIRHRHTTERPYKCSVCKYAFATSSNGKKHESTYHGEYRAVECPVCHKKYKNDQGLGNHQRYSHSNAEGSKKLAPQWKFKEPGCTKDYKSHQGLKRHVNSFHLQQRPFKCLFCAHTTTTSSDLNTHLKTHIQEKPYSCSKCKRCFVSSGGLSKHKATAHSELRPFQCDLCIYSGKTRYCLKRHQKIHELMPTTIERNICKDSRGPKKRTNCCPTKCRLISHVRKTQFNEGSFRSLLTPFGSKKLYLADPKNGFKMYQRFSHSGGFSAVFRSACQKSRTETEFAL